MGRTWLITGSATGLGRAVVAAALEAGDQVVATALDAGDISWNREESNRIVPLALNVTSEADWKDAVRIAVDKFGGIDVLVNCAGVGAVGALEDMKLDFVETLFRINFTGTILGCRAVLPVMRRQGRGSIVLVSSIGARAATAGASIYFASKAAISTFAECFALEVAPFGIKVTAIEPGGMRTNFAEPTSTAMIEPSPGYEETAGKTIAFMRSQQYDDVIRDPAGHAGIVQKIVALDKPPVRLLAGSDAFERGRREEAARISSDERFEELSCSA